MKTQHTQKCNAHLPLVSSYTELWQLLVLLAFAFFGCPS